METMPNRIIECSGTVTFSSLGYPTRVATMRSLQRFVDVMHEGRAEATFRDFLGGGVTPQELELLRTVTRAINENANFHYGVSACATGSLLRALVIFRALTHLYPDKKNLIFEVGHGSGYVGALLLAAGYPYASTDITQAFYLHQSHLLETLAPGRVLELATDPRDFDQVETVEPGHALHIPWWKYYSANPAPKLKVSAVTCNHAFAEMHQNARSYVLKHSSMMLNRDNGAVVFEGWGSTVHTQIWEVTKRFSDIGYVIAHNNITGSVFVPSDCSFAEGALSLPQNQPEPTKKWFGHTDRPSNDDATAYHPPIYITSNSPASKLMTDGMARQQGEMTIAFGDVMEMFRSEIGIADLTTADEYFSILTDSPY